MKREIALLAALSILGGCSTNYPIETQDGYDTASYIVPKNGQILLSGESPKWYNSKERALKEARYQAFHEAMLYTDRSQVEHMTKERSVQYQLERPDGSYPGYQTNSVESKVNIRPNAEPLNVLWRIKDVKCYQKKRDIKYKYRCLALVSIEN